LDQRQVITTIRLMKNNRRQPQQVGGGFILSVIGITHGLK
jgi:hypothetical protein